MSLHRKVILAWGENAKAAAENGFSALVECATEQLPEGKVVIALPGGKTPQQLYELMVAARTEDPDWSSLVDDAEFRPLDERIVPEASPDYNLNDLQPKLFARLALQDGQVRWFRPLVGEPDGGVGLYNRDFAASGGQVHIVIAGAGPRNAGAGHFGSVFSDTLTQIGDATDFVRVRTADKLPEFRVTLGPKAVQRAPIVVLLVSGDRADILRDFAKTGSLEDCPSRALKYAEGVEEPVLILITWVKREEVPEFEF